MQSCALILLAAGPSSRLHKPKQLLNYKGKSLLKHSIEAALDSNAEPIILVTGSNAQEMEKEVTDIKINIIENENWQEGIASSIRCGINALLSIAPEIEQTILMVCDQPYISPSLLNKLIDMQTETGADIIACAYAETIGTPVLFTKNYFYELLKLQGDEGAKKLVMKYKGSAAFIQFPKGEIDIDTGNDYENLEQA